WGSRGFRCVRISAGSRTCGVLHASWLTNGPTTRTPDDPLWRIPYWPHWHTDNRDTNRARYCSWHKSWPVLNRPYHSSARAWPARFSLLPLECAARLSFSYHRVRACVALQSPETETHH